MSFRSAHAARLRSLRGSLSLESGSPGCHLSIGKSIDEADTIVLAGDLLHPAPHIPTQHQRVLPRLGVRSVGGNEGRKRNPCKFGLFESHLIEFRDCHLDRVFCQVKIPLAKFQIPLEKTALIDKVLYQQIITPVSIGSDLSDLLKRGDGWSDDVEQNEIELTGIDQVEESAIVKRFQLVRQHPCAHGNAVNLA